MSQGTPEPAPTSSAPLPSNPPQAAPDDQAALQTPVTQAHTRTHKHTTHTHTHTHTQAAHTIIYVTGHARARAGIVFAALSEPTGGNSISCVIVYNTNTYSMLCTCNSLTIINFTGHGRARRHRRCVRSVRKNRRADHLRWMRQPLPPSLLQCVCNSGRALVSSLSALTAHICHDLNSNRICTQVVLVLRWCYTKNRCQRACLFVCRKHRGSRRIQRDAQIFERDRAKCRRGTNRT